MAIKNISGWGAFTMASLAAGLVAFGEFRDELGFPKKNPTVFQLSEGTVNDVSAQLGMKLGVQHQKTRDLLVEQINSVPTYDDSALKAEVAGLRTAVEGIVTYDDTTLREEVTGLRTAIEAQKGYDDTALREELARYNTEVQSVKGYLGNIQAMNESILSKLNNPKGPSTAEILVGITGITVDISNIKRNQEIISGKLERVLNPPVPVIKAPNGTDKVRPNGYNAAQVAAQTKAADAAYNVDVSFSFTTIIDGKPVESVQTFKTRDAVEKMGAKRYDNISALGEGESFSISPDLANMLVPKLCGAGCSEVYITPKK